MDWLRQKCWSGNCYSFRKYSSAKNYHRTCIPLHLHMATAYRSLDSDYTFFGEYLSLGILLLSWYPLHTTFWVTSSIAVCKLTPELIQAAEHFEHDLFGRIRHRELDSSYAVFCCCVQIEKSGGNNICHAGLGVIFFLQMLTAAAAAENSRGWASKAYGKLKKRLCSL
jgi:hypothetical protein